MSALYYGVEPGRFDPSPFSPLAPLFAEMLLQLSIKGEIKRLERLAGREAISDAWNETLKRRNWETYVRACRLLRKIPIDVILFDHRDLFA